MDADAGEAELQGDVPKWAWLAAVGVAAVGVAASRLALPNRCPPPTSGERWGNSSNLKFSNHERFLSSKSGSVSAVGELRLLQEAFPAGRCWEGCASF